MAWKTPPSVDQTPNLELASMGPRFNGVEDLEADRSINIVREASMGPRFNGVEDRRDVHEKSSSSLASMGPRFNGVEDRAGHDRPIREA